MPFIGLGWMLLTLSPHSKSKSTWSALVSQRPRRWKRFHITKNRRICATIKSGSILFIMYTIIPTSKCNKIRARIFYSSSCPHPPVGGIVAQHVDAEIENVVCHLLLYLFSLLIYIGCRIARFRRLLVFNMYSDEDDDDDKEPMFWIILSSLLHSATDDNDDRSLK